MGHSLGASFIQYFLYSFVDQKWKDQFVASLIPLGGAFGGTAVAYATYALGTNYGIPILSATSMRPMVTNFGSLCMLFVFDVISKSMDVAHCK